MKNINDLPASTIQQLLEIVFGVGCVDCVILASGTHLVDTRDDIGTSLPSDWQRSSRAVTWTEAIAGAYAQAGITPSQAALKFRAAGDDPWDLTNPRRLSISETTMMGG